MTPEHEIWAEALAVERRYGDDAPRHVSERVGALAVAGDRAGIARWVEIAERLAAISRLTFQPRDA